MSLAVLRDSKPYPVAASIVQKLQEHGYVAYFAGGCVRDALQDIPPKDIDIATSANPDQVQATFSEDHSGGRSNSGWSVSCWRIWNLKWRPFVPTESIWMEGVPSEIRFSTPEQDALRRDFTINGMFYDPLNDRVIDYVERPGGPVSQADPGDRPSRPNALRKIVCGCFARSGLLRLLAFEIESGTWSAIKAEAQEIAIVSPERIRDELLKILVNPHRLRGFDLLDKSGLLAVILPEIEALKGCDQPEQFHPEGDVFVHTRLMLSLLAPNASAAQVLAVLLHDIGKPPTRSFDPVDQRIRFNGHDRVGAEMAEAVMTRLRFPRHEIDLVVEAVRNHMIFKDVQQMRPARLRRFMARPHFGIELELHRVDCAGSHGDLENYQFLVQQSVGVCAGTADPGPFGARRRSDFDGFEAGTKNR